MNEFLKNLKNEFNFTETENGAGALKSTNNAVLDAFGSLGAMKDAPDSQITLTFEKAFEENKDLALRLWFYIRDCRGGQGMRRVFHVISKWLAEFYPRYVIANLSNFLEYGRGDDLLYAFASRTRQSIYKFIKTQIDEDLTGMRNGKSVSLLAKWLPSENTSSLKTRAIARDIRTNLKMTPRQYRKILSALRSYINIVEQKMSKNRWEDIKYDIVPGKAHINYRKAFARHDYNRYSRYLTTGKINATALFPVDIVHQALSLPSGDTLSCEMLDKMWKSLPNYLEGREETGICVVDTSGSMSGTPIEVALSLGMYCADKCRGPFKGHFITFSARPQLQSIVGEGICSKVQNMERANWDSNTNLEAVFDLILQTAARAHLKDKDMPKKLYIISDMQFDAATTEYYYDFSNRYAKVKNRNSGLTFMRQMRAKYESYGYIMPAIVYWNVRASDKGMFQETINGENCAMVSGYSPSLFKSVIDGTTVEYTMENGKVQKKETIDPINVMLTALMNERYDKVITEL